MSGAESDDRTILDYLNEDCWRAVLDYVSLEHILRTEAASRCWQEVVLTYLRGVRIDIKAPPRFWKGNNPITGLNNPRWFNLTRNSKKNKLCRPRITRHCRSPFENWTNKLGPSVANVYCDSTDALKMYENCPNLESVTFMDLSEATILGTRNENLKWLKRLSFKKCEMISDHCVSKFMTNNTLEELEIRDNSKVTGEFLVTEKSMKLMSLSMRFCWNMNLAHFVEASDFLGGLRKLELSDSVQIYKDIHLMLDKMPNLEHVKMEGAGCDGRNFFEAVCRLKHLKDLCVDFIARDDDLEAVTRCCPELKALRLGYCNAVSQRGLEAACAHAGSRLVTLCLGRSNRHLKDDHILACIRACPNLTTLNVRGSGGLTRGLIKRAAAARRAMHAPRPLKLRCGSLFRQGSTQNRYEVLIVLP